MSVINKHSKENGSNTPDFILAEYLIECLRAFDKTTRLRTEWYGEKVCEEKITESRNEFDKDEEKLFFEFPEEKPGYPSRRNAELP